MDKRSRARLPAQVLRRVTAGDLWWAREQLLEDPVYTPFDESEKYDVLLEDGRRLPPKALFGKALTRALGYQALPKHFVGGESSTCFRILRGFGFAVVPKRNNGDPSVGSSPPADREWTEGDKKWRWHLRSERRSGLAAAKREQFRRDHGQLYCERCGMDPLERYGDPLGESCIEVHHAKVRVTDMQPGHLTRLEDLQCLCANCHRVTHREAKP